MKSAIPSCLEETAGESRRTRDLLAALVLLLGTLAVYAPALGQGFVAYDDDVYVVANPMVSGGLTLEGARWAFTSFHSYNWHPLTWLSHMLDCQIFGLDAGGHHATSLALHALNVLLLFAFLRRTARSFWPALLVAALFAMHPLRVESVAWVAERKDVLSGTFFFLTLLAYARHAARPTRASLALVALGMALGLMAKPMLVSLPLVLLLLDLWPLGRWRPGEPAAVARELVREKLPLFAVAALSAVVTVLAQRTGGALSSLATITPDERLANAITATTAYLGTTVWPAGLAVFYPHPAIVDPEGSRLGPALLGGLLLLSITVLALRARRERPYLAVGWLWFLVMLLPTIGLVQVGEQARADRYAYLPLVGVYVMAVFAAQELARRVPRAGPVLVGCAVVSLLVLGGAARGQVSVWRDTQALFQHALAATEKNYVAHNNLGMVLGESGRLDEAVEHFESALEILPGFGAARRNLALAEYRAGRLDRAAAAFQALLDANPADARARFDLASVYSAAGDTESARRELERVVAEDGTNIAAREALAEVRLSSGQVQAAVSELRAVLELEPTRVQSATLLAWTLATSSDATLGEPGEALAWARRAHELVGDDPFVLEALAASHAALGQGDEAVRWQRRALEEAPAEELDAYRERLRLYEAGLPYRERP